MGHFKLRSVKVKYDPTRPGTSQTDADEYALTDARTRSKVNLSQKHKLVFLRTDTDVFFYVAPRKHRKELDIGSGGFGTCYIGKHLCDRDTTPQNVCIKVSSVKRSPNSAVPPLARSTLQNAAQTGFAVANRFDPSLMIALLETEDTFYSVMTLARGSVDHYKSGLSVYVEKDRALVERHAAAMFHGIATALIPMHQQGYVHDDVKMQNMLIDQDGRIRLCDYELAHRVPHPRCITKANPLYDAPERWLSQDEQNCLGLQPSDAESVKSDVYSAAVAACLLAGISFFSSWKSGRANALAFFSGYEQIRRSPRTFALNDAPPQHRDSFKFLQKSWLRVNTELPKLAPLIYRSLALLPAERPSMTELRDAVQDAYPQGLLDGLWQTPRDLAEQRHKSFAALQTQATLEIVNALRHVTQPRRPATSRTLAVVPTSQSNMMNAIVPHRSKLPAPSSSTTVLTLRPDDTRSSRLDDLDARRKSLSNKRETLRILATEVDTREALAMQPVRDAENELWGLQKYKQRWTTYGQRLYGDIERYRHYLSRLPANYEYNSLLVSRSMKTMPPNHYALTSYNPRISYAGRQPTIGPSHPAGWSTVNAASVLQTWGTTWHGAQRAAVSFTEYNSRLATGISCLPNAWMSARLLDHEEKTYKRQESLVLQRWTDLESFTAAMQNRAKTINSHIKECQNAIDGLEIEIVNNQFTYIFWRIQAVRQGYHSINQY